MNLRDVPGPLHARLLAACGGLALLVGASCASRGNVSLEEEPPIAFGAPDAGARDDADASLPESTRMCAVTACSLPYATCPSSEFPCDANLLKDDDNCGACGVRCAGENVLLADKWTCVDGQCAFSCSLSGRRNCDNDPANGCETYTLFDALNCGYCGNACPGGWECYAGECVPNACRRADRPDICDGVCTNLTNADDNCGACGTVCDPTGPNLPALAAGMHYGCGQGTCGKPKCNGAKKADCNNDPSDGCEATLNGPDNCSACGDACAKGKVCASVAGVYSCLCDNGETYCGSAWKCRQLDDDPGHCGGCNHVCPAPTLPHFVPTCSSGVCGGKCADDYSDCDGARDNGCEVNTRVDNRNCGACGHACLPDQVCSEGQCLVAPCPPEGPTTK